MDKDEELIDLWKVQVEDLRFTKRQHWLVIIYGLLIQGGIIQLLNIIKKVILLELDINGDFLLYQYHNLDAPRISLG